MFDIKRKHPRAPIELKVEYERLNTFFADFTKNISRGGTFIKTDKPLEIGTEFIFKLYIPNLNEPLTLKGLVRWKRDAQGFPKPNDPGLEPFYPGMGIEFVYDNPEQKVKIEQEVEKLMTSSLGDLLYRKLLKT